MSEHPHADPKRFQFRRNRLALAAAGLLVVGGAAGAVTVAATRPSVTMAPATPVAIRSLGSDGIVTIRGRVAEIYGNKFVMADQTGRALVDLGREGEDTALVTAGQPVTIQGRFDHGYVHASFLVGAGGKVTALGPLGGPRGHHGPDRDGPGRGGPGRDRPDRGGPDRGPDGGSDRGPGAPPAEDAARAGPAVAPGAAATPTAAPAPQAAPTT